MHECLTTNTSAYATLEQLEMFREISGLQGNISVQLQKGYYDDAQELKPPPPARCYIKLRTPNGTRLVLEVMNVSHDRAVAVHDLAYPSSPGRLYAAEFLSLKAGMAVVSTTNVLIIRLELQELIPGVLLLYEFHASIRYRTSFLALSELEVTKVSTGSATSTGTIQTPLYDGTRRLLMLEEERSLAELTVPPDHVLMLSFAWEKVRGCVSVWVQRDTNQELVLDVCCDFLPSTLQFNNVSMLTVGFRVTIDCSSGIFGSDVPAYATPGLSMAFSILNESRSLQQLPSGVWNCSAPHWPDLQQHFPCNMHKDCEDGQDEIHCPYYRYLNMPQWSDGTVEFSLQMNDHIPACAIVDFTFVEIKSLPAFGCGHLKVNRAVAVCEKRQTLDSSKTKEIDWPSTTGDLKKSENYVVCASGYTTHRFLAFDAGSDCCSGDRGECSPLVTSHPPVFQCSKGGEHVPYTLVCDHKADCIDNSDEAFCVFQPCKGREWDCGDGQCIELLRYCDGWTDCHNHADEMGCDYLFYYKTEGSHYRPPAVVSLSTKGNFIYEQLKDIKHVSRVEDGIKVPEMSNDRMKGSRFDDGLTIPEISRDPQSPEMSAESSPAIQKNGLEGNRTGRLCPDTHFQCPDNGYCLPVFLRCNKVYDCPFHEDEAGCDSYVCPGFYRCRGSNVCLHPDSVCDGHPHCPQNDDESLCDFTCPEGCECFGQAFTCTQRFLFADYPHLRYLDAKTSNITLADLKHNQLVVHLDLTHCNLTFIGDSPSLPNLLVLDLSYNRLTDTDWNFLNGMPQLRHLSLTANPLTNLFDNVLQPTLESVESLHLSHVEMPDLNISSVAAIFPNLELLNLSDCDVQRVVGDGFRQLPRLGVLDLRGSLVVAFPNEMFQNLKLLQYVYAQTFKLCCPTLLPPQFNVRHCEAPVDELSSCEDLLGSVTYVISLFVLAVLAVVGNCTSFVYRSLFNRSGNKLGFGVFVTHLCVSDFLMGVYLLIIGSADRLYQGTYLWNEYRWRHSVACNLAGFLSFLSNEVSALIICLITLDRFLVLRFPFSRLHFSVRSAHIACAVVWCLGFLVALIPLLPVTSHWQFYSQTAICIPLPITRNDFPGQRFSFSIIIVLNFILFILISLGQVVIYWSVQVNAMSTDNSTKKTKDLTIARRLVTVAMTDFLCWFPIGLLGLLASRGVPISSEINVAMAVFVLPLNSALNPFLYTINVIMERRRLASEERLRQRIRAQIQRQADLK